VDKLEPRELLPIAALAGVDFSPQVRVFADALRGECNAVAKALEIHVPDVLARKVELGNRQVAGGLSRAVASL